MNKNPFEIRAEMLQLAKDYMDKQQEMNSMDELMGKAKEMYSFVSKKD